MKKLLTFLTLFLMLGGVAGANELKPLNDYLKTNNKKDLTVNCSGAARIPPSIFDIPPS